MKHFLQEAFANEFAQKVVVEKLKSDNMTSSDLLNIACHLNAYFREDSQSGHKSLVGTIRAFRLIKRASSIICPSNQYEVKSCI